jgi:hypothetical protein
MIKKNFFRKVALGIGPNEKIPSEPVSWAQNQVDKVPSVIWDEPIRTGEEMLNYYAEWVYTDREILRKNIKAIAKPTMMQKIAFVTKLVKDILKI